MKKNGDLRLRFRLKANWDQILEIFLKISAVEAERRGKERVSIDLKMSAAAAGGAGAGVAGEDIDGYCGEGRSLDLLPAALLETVMAKLDVTSLCSLASTSRIFRACVSHVLAFTPNFHLLDLALSTDMIRPLMPPNPLLKSLKLDCDRLDDSSIDILVRPSLHEICLQNCKDFSGKLLHEIGWKCKDLRFLCLGSVAEKRGRTIDHAALEQLLCGCHHLEVLMLMFDLSLYLRPDLVRIWDLISNRLTHLELGHITSKMMTQLLVPSRAAGEDQKGVPPAPFRNVQKLRLSVDCIDDALVRAVSKVLVSLSHLELCDAPLQDPRLSSDLTNAGLQEINQNGKLKHLSLIRSQEFNVTYFRRVNDQGILFLADKCWDMESICLGGFCQVTDAGFKTILHSCANLQSLGVYHGAKLTDLVFHDVSATSLSLTRVSLRRCHLLTNHAIRNLASNLKLENLDLRGCINLGDGALQAIGHLPKLKVLLLDGSNISDAGMAFLGEGVVGSLVSLSVRGCEKLTDKFMSTLFDRPSKLELRELDVSNLPRLSDAGILTLAKSGTAITKLRLRECPLIGDTSIMALASTRVDENRCPGSSLCLLDLYDCGGITQLSFKWLKRPYFPRLRWLGVTGSVNRDIVDALARNRPYLRVACRGDELGDEQEDDWDSLDVHSHNEAAADELEEWIQEDEDDDDDDVEMLDAEEIHGIDEDEDNGHIQEENE